MGIEPKIPRPKLIMRRCTKCGIDAPTSEFAATHSLFYPDGYLPVCNDCINIFLKSHSYEWEWIDKVCQWADIPFIVKEWERLIELNGLESTWPTYAHVFADQCYQNLGWRDYDQQYRKLKEVGMITEEIPGLREQHLQELQNTWGSNYSEEELRYLEDLYQGLLLTQNVNGPLQKDQARKLCKLSLEIDSRIRAGDKDVDKFLSSYDKVVKAAEFTPKNTKNAADFDSFAEVAHWLEKRGHVNRFYDGSTRDVIDEELKTIQNYNQKLYINEGGIGQEITERLMNLQKATQFENQESIYDLRQEFDLDEFDNDAFKVTEEEEFNAEEDGNGRPD